MASEKRSIFDNPGAFLETARRLARSGRGDSAMKLVDKLRVERPGDPLLGALARQILTKGVPGFHGHMLMDAARNAAYARAIEAMAPGRRVLDIGAGSGLLAMIAARAGARSVVACEYDPMLAATARQIVAANGLADRVKVLPVHSGKLDRKRDLDGGVDLVVSEVFADDLLGEHALASLAQARAQLCRPGARFIPAAASIRVALADFPEEPLNLEDIEGFDLSLFARHLSSIRQVRPNSAKLVLRSDPVDLFRFEFDAERNPPRSQRARETLSSHGGRVAGLAQWLRIELAPGVVYENAPGLDDRHHWLVPFHPIALRETGAGETITVAGWHDTLNFALWAE